MAHCPPELLADLAAVLAELRSWTGLVETKPGVFYLRKQPFLHFHLAADGGRHADVKGRTEWTRIQLPRPLPATVRRGFLRELQVRYRDRAAQARAARR